jgi:EAL and modified HD-GYP domain-containing signal transduction protein
MNSPDTPSTLPLITLQPVADSGNVWVAFLLEAAAAETPLTAPALTRLMHECALSKLLEAVPCVVHADPMQVDPTLGGSFPAGQLILCIPVAQAADPSCHGHLAALHAAGFGLMAAGFPPAGATLFAEIKSLAVTCPGHAMPAGFGDWLRQLPGPHLALGTTENVCPGFCKFHWLAGHLAGHAAPPAKGDPTTRALLLRLLSLVTSDADASELEAVIKRDTNLSFHLLKLVNSVAFASTKQITNFSQAIALLGRRQLQRWLQLLLYTRAKGDMAASPLLPRAALRASLMEALAKRGRLSRDVQDHAYMVGMFSLLDVLFGAPILEVIAPLNLPEHVVEAFTTGGGQLGGLLTAVSASEGPPGQALADALAAAAITPENWAAALIDAAGWAIQVSKEA